LTGEPIVSAQTADSLFRLLLTRSTFERPASNFGRDNDVEHIENPFLARSGPSDDTVRVRLALELERCSYEPPIDTKSEIAVFWVLGILGTAAVDRDRVAGSVQWRAHIYWPGRIDSSQFIGRGFSVGNPHKLGRREALALANRRAFYDLAAELSFVLNDELKLGLNRRMVLETLDEYKKAVDAP